MIRDTFTKESILDNPQDDLDTSVWTKNSEGQYIPTIQASQKIKRIIDWAINTFKITDPVVHITGSIASNSYGDSSDVDLHFCSDTFKPGDIDEFNKEFRKSFTAEFGKDTGSETGMIGIHPVEVYFQKNPFQDMMSVGCYDITNNKWESGPEIKDTVFDPLSEYYEKDMKYIDKIISDIRDNILAVYEIALVIQKSENNDFIESQYRKLKTKLNEAKNLYNSIRKSRKVLSEPKSKEEALKKRNDHKWHIADSSFKLMDKFGYTAILKEYTDIYSDFDILKNDCINRIIKIVQDNITSNKMLTDSEIAGMPGWKSEDLIRDIREWLNNRIYDYQLNIEIIDIALHGSRIRGDFRRDSDLDVIVYYKGADSSEKHIKEDHIFNMLNDEPCCTIDGIKIDFNPICDEESGSLTDYLKKDKEYDMIKTTLTEKDVIDEGIGKMLSIGVLASLLAMPSAFGKTKTKAEIEKMIEKDRTYQGVMSSLANDSIAKYGDYTDLQAANIIARTLYAEAAGEGTNGIKLVATTIYNRSGGDTNKLAAVCLEDAQYSCWNSITNKSASTYKFDIPSGIKKNMTDENISIYEKCKKTAVDMLIGKFKPVNDYFNSYYNPDKANPSWKDDIVKEEKNGNHIFGYLPEHDGYSKKIITRTEYKKLKAAKIKDTIYTVKAGDTIGKIAKSHNTTVQAIKKLNKNLKDVNNIKPGQKLRIA